MDEKKKKQYTIFGAIAAVAFIAIMVIPSPNSTKTKVSIPPSVSPPVKNVEIPKEFLKEQPKYSSEPEDIVLETHFNRKVKRDIFINPMLVKNAEKENVANQSQSNVQEKPKVQIKVTGVMITSKKKSVTLDDGRIFYEKDIADNYIVSKVEREEVLFISRDGKDSQRVKVWGGGE